MRPPHADQYEKLPEGKLKDQIYDLAGKLGFPLTKVMCRGPRSSFPAFLSCRIASSHTIVVLQTITKLFVMDGSKRSR